MLEVSAIRLLFLAVPCLTGTKQSFITWIADAFDTSDEFWWHPNYKVIECLVYFSIYSNDPKIHHIVSLHFDRALNLAVLSFSNIRHHIRWPKCFCLN